MGEIDEYLRSFVRWADREVPEGEMGVTFTASGLVIDVTALPRSFGASLSC